ncbi:uncharacterized protein STEHIDRAFT_150536 [Stereum hirsutum FP-91666 SS1]|uniref:Uncharacterized protein n=1 Tax=Stereum hirsutum (strain FP-91666) TaxID=721885 RepID=R7RY78_STEHR|nr:uncharacterized protein STEHIDRAFT_150536 [Stereum hirsutum FP-91666 SS1]EIM80289.1 hypothetical protein STEHIDRAFT_150536 [Stereum hirsutum FP-91666 SS1]
MGVLDALEWLDGGLWSCAILETRSGSPSFEGLGGIDTNEGPAGYGGEFLVTDIRSGHRWGSLLGDHWRGLEAHERRRQRSHSDQITPTMCSPRWAPILVARLTLSVWKFERTFRVRIPYEIPLCSPRCPTNHVIVMHIVKISNVTCRAPCSGHDDT